MQVHQAKDATQSQLTEQADVVIIGSGAGGAVMAYELANVGYKVVVLEAGPYVTSDQFDERFVDAMERLYEDGGAQTNVDGDITILQGRCVGGSTVVNATVAFRIPDRILEEWATDYGVTGMSPEAMTPLYEQIEKRLAVHPNYPHEINTNSRLLLKGAENLGWAAHPTPRNVKACALSGFCTSGCRYDRKQSMLVTYLPWAVEKGAKIFADTQVHTITTEAGQATGVQASIIDPVSGEVRSQLTVNAKTVVLAAGAVQSPLLLLKNGLANSSGQVGHNFACHPAFGLLALFDEPVNMWDGALIGAHLDEFADTDKGGFLYEGGGGEPAALAQYLPNMGASHRQLMAKLDHIASMVEILSDDNVGQISWDGERKRIDYQLSDKDQGRIKQAMKLGAQLWFAAGAKEVYLPTMNPITLTNESQLDSIDQLEVGPSSIMFSSFHPQGSLRMGADPASSVVNSFGQTHDIPNLVVADASVFPTSVLVNTQMPVYGAATRFAQYMIEQPQRYGL